MKPDSSLTPEQLSKINESFDNWMDAMDYLVEDFVDEVFTHTNTRLDYSPDSLNFMEAWLLKNFDDPDELLGNLQIWDGSARYFGEVIRRNLGHEWVVDVFEIELRVSSELGKPALLLEKGEKYSIICPLFYGSAAMDRRTGTYLSEGYDYVKKSVEEM